MRSSSRFAPIAAIVLLAVGCGMFDDHGARRDGDGGRGADGRRGAERCDVDLDHWKARVRGFKDADHRRKEDFRQAKDDLLRDLDRLDTSGCRRDLRNQVSDLIDQVRAERF